MMRWLLWFFAPLPLFALDGWLASTGWPAPDLTVALCLYFGLFARPGALPGLIVCAALGRAVMLSGDAALHVLVLGVPAATLMPLRAVLFRRSPWLQMAMAALLAIVVPKVAALFGRLVEDAPAVAPVDGAAILQAALLVPPATWLLRRLPPLAQFEEAAQ